MFVYAMVEVDAILRGHLKVIGCNLSALIYLKFMHMYVGGVGVIVIFI